MVPMTCMRRRPALRREEGRQPLSLPLAAALDELMFSPSLSNRSPNERRVRGRWRDHGENRSGRAADNIQNSRFSRQAKLKKIT